MTGSPPITGHLTGHGQLGAAEGSPGHHADAPHGGVLQHGLGGAGGLARHRHHADAVVPVHQSEMRSEVT